MRAAILAVVIALVAAAASATERRTDELLWMCEGRVSDNEFENAMEQALCIGYIDGIVDSNAMMQGFLGVQLFWIEQPDVWKFGTPLISHPLLSK